jgi:hypothetical protein
MQRRSSTRKDRVNGRKAKSLGKKKINVSVKTIFNVMEYRITTFGEKSFLRRLHRDLNI